MSENCCLCFENITDQTGICKLECKHIFCAKCLIKYISEFKGNCCPLCRDKLISANKLTIGFTEPELKYSLYGFNNMCGFNYYKINLKQTKIFNLNNITFRHGFNKLKRSGFIYLFLMLNDDHQNYIKTIHNIEKNLKLFISQKDIKFRYQVSNYIKKNNIITFSKNKCTILNGNIDNLINKKFIANIKITLDEIISYYDCWCVDKNIELDIIG